MRETLELGTKFCLIVYSKEARAFDKEVMTKEGDAFWVETDEPDQWVEATSSTVRDRNNVPARVKTFPTREDAAAFASRWKGHPWWCLPNGRFDVVEIAPRYVEVHDGWSVVP